MKVPASIGHRRVALQTRLHSWPTIDQELWAAALDETDILSPTGGAADWAQATRQTVIKGYGRWLAWLASEGRLDEAQPPGARATPERVAAYVQQLRNDNSASTTTWGYVHALAMTLMVMEPTADIEWLWEIDGRLRRLKIPSRRKADRVVPVAELNRLGFFLMNAAETSFRADSLAGARLFRNGLMIALLAARPIRIRNLRSILIGQQLIKSNGRYCLIFRKDETKTHKALEFDIPEEISARMAIYLSKYRPVLVGRFRAESKATKNCVVGEALWVSMFGTAMTDSSLYQAISDMTRRAFGKHINPHLFRDCAATSIALQDPAHVQITTSILGHATLATSERYYNHALSTCALSMHQATIIRARKASAKNARAHAAASRIGLREAK